MSEYVLTLLTPEQVRTRWADLERLLLPAEPYSAGEIAVADVLELVDARRAFVLALFDRDQMILAGVLEVLTYPRKCVLNVILMGGRNFGVVVERFMGGIKEIANTLGATALRGCVRPAMAKFLCRTQPGTRVIYSVTEVDL